MVNSWLSWWHVLESLVDQCRSIQVASTLPTCHVLSFYTTYIHLQLVNFQECVHLLSFIDPWLEKHDAEKTQTQILRPLIFSLWKLPSPRSFPEEPGSEYTPSPEHWLSSDYTSCSVTLLWLAYISSIRNAPAGRLQVLDKWHWEALKTEILFSPIYFPTAVPQKGIGK